MTDQDVLPRFFDRLEFLRSCCLNHPQEFSSPVVEVIAWEEGCECWPQSCGSYCDGWERALVRLESGRYGVLTAWEDATGHGCRCDSALIEFDTLDDATTLGLTEEERAKLKLAHRTPAQNTEAR